MYGSAELIAFMRIGAALLIFASTSSISHACSGRGIELRIALDAKTAFFGELLQAGPVSIRDDRAYEQTLVFSVRQSFRGNFRTNDIAVIKFQSHENLMKQSSERPSHVEIGQKYAIVTSRLLPQLTNGLATRHEGHLNPRNTYLSPKSPCVSMDLRLVKETHPIGRALWVIFTGDRQTHETRADVLTEYLRTDGRF